MKSKDIWNIVTVHYHACIIMYNMPIIKQLFQHVWLDIMSYFLKILQAFFYTIQLRINYTKIYSHWSYKLFLSVGIHLNYDDCNSKSHRHDGIALNHNISCNYMSILICLSRITENTMKIDNLNFTQSVLIFNIRELASWKIILVFVYTTYKIPRNFISIYDCKLTMDITNCVTCSSKTKHRRCKTKQRLVTSRFIVTTNWWRLSAIQQLWRKQNLLSIMCH